MMVGKPTVKIAGFVTDFPGRAAATPVVTETTASKQHVRHGAGYCAIDLPGRTQWRPRRRHPAFRGRQGRAQRQQRHRRLQTCAEGGRDGQFRHRPHHRGLDSILILRNSARVSIPPTADDSSTSVGGGSTASTDSYLSYTVTTSGTYYIDVRSYNFGSRGSYQLADRRDRHQPYVGGRSARQRQ
jgi:hypothetical protein